MVNLDKVFKRYFTFFSKPLQLSQVLIEACKHINSRLINYILASCNSFSKDLTLGSRRLLELFSLLNMTTSPLASSCVSLNAIDN